MGRQKEREVEIVAPLRVAIVADVLRCELVHGALEQQWWGPGHTAVLRGALALAARRSCRGIIVSGQRGVFWHTLAGVPVTQRALHSGAVEEACCLLERCPIPTLALVEGVCEGVGLALALHCDHIWAVPSPETRFWIAHVHGLMPGWERLMRRLTRRVGVAGAAALACGGQVWSAEQAQVRGLVERLAAQQEEAHEFWGVKGEQAAHQAAQVAPPPDEEERRSARFWANQRGLWALYEEEAPALSALLVMERLAQHTTTRGLCARLEAPGVRGVRVMRNLSHAAGREDGAVMGVLLSSHDQPQPKRCGSRAEDITVHNIFTRELPWRGRQHITHMLPVPLDVLPVVECAGVSKGVLPALQRAWRLGLQRAGLHVLTTRPQRSFVLEQLVAALCRGLAHEPRGGAQVEVCWLREGALVQPLQRMAAREGVAWCGQTLGELEAVRWSVWGRAALLWQRGELTRLEEVEGAVWRLLGCKPADALAPRGVAPAGLLSENEQAAMAQLAQHREAALPCVVSDWRDWTS